MLNVQDRVICPLCLGQPAGLVQRNGVVESPSHVVHVVCPGRARVIISGHWYTQCWAEFVPCRTSASKDHHRATEAQSRKAK
jgi:hypothetical protein